MKKALLRPVILCAVVVLYLCTPTFAQQKQFSLPEGCTKNDYVKNVIIYKVSENAFEKGVLNTNAAAQLKAAFSSLQVQETSQIFPNHKAPIAKTNAAGLALTDLSRIFECTYKSELPIEEAINILLATGTLEYAQPRYINYPMWFNPADPFNTNQYHLGRMKLFDAWDIEKGDTNIVIGITDWGVNLLHPDLIGNIKYNHEDPIDGIDNDNDGYIDNYYGWDMGCNDNDPTGISAHGTFVSGCSSASTNNGTGVSGTGFKCKFIHVKVADNNNNGTRCYEGIVYAADHGCRVLNCSWGGTFYQGPFGQDIINYATIDKNALVVAAAGNTPASLWFFPASYDYVLSVAGSTNADVKWSGSTFGTKVDVCAPGELVWTTGGGGTYDCSSGTSFASPLVAGVAALVWSHFPSLSALQLSAKIKANCDIIDTVPGNGAYAGLLGAGRVNAFRALTDSTSSYVEMLNIQLQDLDGDQFFERSDTLSVIGDFYNFLEPTSSACKATLKATSAYVTVVDSVFQIGALNTLSSVSNTANPFSFKISPITPAGQILTLRISITDSTGKSFQYITLTANSDFLTMDTNDIAVTLTSNGIIGYNNGNTTQGVGFTYNHGVSLISTAGFIAGISPSQVSDALPGFDGSIDKDFVSLDQVRKFTTNPAADFVAQGFYSDSIAVGRMNLRVKHTTLGWDEVGKEKFIIQKYTLFNDSTASLADLHAGIFFDWDISNSMGNTAAWDDQRKLSYVFPYGGGTYVGTKLLSSGGSFHYAFDNDGTNGSIKISDGFTGLEKYVTLKSNRSDAGNFVNGNDVSTMLSYGPLLILPGDSAEIAFAILVADHLNDLQLAADEAQSTFDALSQITSPIPQGQQIAVYPNPCTNSITVDILLSSPDCPKITIMDQTGRIVFSQVNVGLVSGKARYEIPTFSLDPGLYFIEVRTSENVFAKKMLKF